MKLTTRIRTWRDRLKFRLLEDEIADRHHDLLSVTSGGASAPAAVLQDYLRLEATLVAVNERLQAESVPHNHRAMGNGELLGSLLGTFLVLLGILVGVMGLPL